MKTNVKIIRNAIEVKKVNECVNGDIIEINIKGKVVICKVFFNNKTECLSMVSMVDIDFANYWATIDHIETACKYFEGTLKISRGES